MGKTSFVIGMSWAKRMLDVPDDDFATIVKAVFQFAVDGQCNQLSGLHKALVTEMTDFLAENEEKYREVCEKRRAAGAIGGKQKVANAKQKVAKGSKCQAKGSNGKQNVADNDYDNDNDNDYENDDEYDVLTDIEEKEDANASKKDVFNKQELFTDIINRWNAYTDRGDIPMVKTVSPDSKCGKSIIARVKQYGIDAVMNVIDDVFRSDFLRGKDGKWCAKFDWVFLPNNFEKIVNGNYNTQKRTSMDRQADVLREWMDQGKESIWSVKNSTTL